MKTVLANVEMVHLDFRIWGGERKLDREDLGINLVPDLPEDDRVVSLGRKKLISAERLKPLVALRSEANTLLMREGVSFMGGFAVPETAVSSLVTQLDTICSNFDLALRDFLANYDQWVEEWALENADFTDVILKSKLPAQIVKSRCKAEYTIFRVASSPFDASNSLTRKSDTLASRILMDVHTSLSIYIQKIDDAYMDGRQDSTFRSSVRATVKGIAEKLRRFAFADQENCFLPFADELDSAVAGEGQIVKEDFRRLAKLLRGLGSYPDFERRVKVRGVKTDLASALVDDQSSGFVMPDTFVAEPYPFSEGRLLSAVDDAPNVNKPTPVEAQDKSSSVSNIAGSPQVKKPISFNW